MSFEDLYRTLVGDRTPRDVREVRLQEPDAWVYRLAFSSVAMAGMPESACIGGVDVDRVVGPLLTQRTEIRQQHGLPIVFDKAMYRDLEVGRNAVLTVCQIREEFPAQPGARIAELRERAMAAVGVLAAVLDERVAIEQVLEDVILLADGVPYAPGDARLSLRSFLPFDVTAEERDTIAALTTLDLAGVTQLSQAARSYLRAAQQGPVADSIVLLWIAIEALTPHRTTSPKTVEALLLAAGFDPALLDIGLGRLAGLRAEIVHQGRADPELVRDGYYRLEAVVRALLRQAAGATSSWPPIVSAGVFGERADEIERRAAAPEIVWHDELPHPGEPQPAGLGWDRVQQPLTDRPAPLWLTVGGELQPGWTRRLSFWMAQAREALDIDVDPPLEVMVGAPPGGPADVRLACNPERIVIRPELLTLPDPVRELRLARLLTEALAQVALMRTGVESSGLGIALIELAGGWAGYRTFFGPDGPLSDDDLVIRRKDANDLHTMGELLGAALAGSAKASVTLAEWSGSPDADPALVELAHALLKEWPAVESFAELLARLQELIEHIQAAEDNAT